MREIGKQDIVEGLRKLGVEPEMILEVHSSLSSFGWVQGGAETVIEALKEVVSEEGSLFMPALRLSPELPLTKADKELGILTKIKILPEDCEHSAMGLIADTFRKMPDTYTGEGVFRISAWGKLKKKASEGLNYPIHHGGKALLMGVDIYKLTAMHYVENDLPEEIRKIFAPNEAVNRIYPVEEWLIETGALTVKPWYTIQERAYQKGLIREIMIGSCKVMFFDIWEVVGLYEAALKENPFKLYGLR